MENEEFGRILDIEVYEIIRTGEVIEEYLENEEVAIVITVYQPNPDLWIDHKRRRS